jgi:hypothetical protein
VCALPPVAAAHDAAGTGPGAGGVASRWQASREVDPGYWGAFQQQLQNELGAKSQHTLKVSRQECLGAVDFVFTWVNGSEPAHQRARNQFIPSFAFDSAVDLGNGKHMRAHDLQFRFRDFGPASTLKFAIKAVFRHAPWFRNIFILVQDGQRPDLAAWFPPPSGLDVSRISLVAHSAIFANPQDCLPTFNSCAIETAIHRIPGLAECYIYSNDDVLLIQDLTMDWYWPPHDPVPRAVFDGGLAPRVGRDEWQRKLANVARLLEFELGLNWDSVFTVGHHGHFFVKHVAFEVERALQRDVSRTQCERWRSSESLWMPFVYANYYAHKYPALAQREEFGYHRLVDSDKAVRNLAAAIAKATGAGKRWLCVNDLMGAAVDPAFTKAMAEQLEALVQR